MKKRFKLFNIFIFMIITFGLLGDSADFATTGAYIKSDTPANLSISPNNDYTFKMTVVGKIQGHPAFSVGNASVIRITDVQQNGNDYFVTITPRGGFGDSTGLYSKISGQAVVRQTVVTVGASTENFIQGFDFLYNSSNRNSQTKIKNWAGISAVNLLWGTDEFSGVPVTITNSNPDVLELCSGSHAQANSSLAAYTSTSDEWENHLDEDWADPDPAKEIKRLSSDNYFYVNTLKAGTGTITISIKSPKNGKLYTDSQIWTVYDPADKKITSDSPQNISLGKGKAYTFKFTASAQAADGGIQFSTNGNSYYKDSSGQEVTLNDSGLIADITDQGNGVYIVKILAEPDSGSSDVYLKSGDVFSLDGKFSGLESTTLCRITIS